MMTMLMNNGKMMKEKMLIMKTMKERVMRKKKSGKIKIVLVSRVELK